MPLRALALLFLISGGVLPLRAGESSSRAVVKTDAGDILIELDASAAPHAVAQFQKFAEEKVYLDSNFDQAPGSAIQGGKPGSQKGEHSESGNFACTKGAPAEFALKHVRGAVVFARTVGGCNPVKANNSTQFCIYVDDKPQNENEFTVFGRVVEGMDVVEKIRGQIRRDPPQPVKIQNVVLAS